MFKCFNVQKCFRKRNKTFQVFTGVHILQNSIQLSICGLCWTNKSDPWRTNLTTYSTLINILVPDNVAHLVESMTLRGQCCFGSKSGANTITH